MIKLKITLFLTVLACFVNAQTVQLNGKVVDKSSKIPLPNVSVTFNNVGATTNQNGYFSLPISKEVLRNQILLTISYVGYKTQKEYITTNSFLNIALEVNETVLNEVVVSSGAERIVRKAIEKIPYNYPQYSFTQQGILRFYRTETDTPKIYRYFKSDAIIKLHYPSYSDTLEDTKTEILQNKTISLYPTQAPYDSSLWRGGYRVDDFIHKRSGFINLTEVDNYKYNIIGKTILQDVKVWIITFKAKNNSNSFGTLFIDTASYAIVAAKYTKRNIRSFRSRTIENVDYDVLFKKNNGVWNLSKKSTRILYKFSKAKKSFYQDYFCTSIDSTATKSFGASKYFVNRNDDDDKINIHAPDSLWQYYDSLLVKLESEQAIINIPLPTIDSKLSKYDEGVNYEDIPFYKRPDYLENTRLRVTISMDHINIRSSPLSRGSLGVGFGAGIRIMPTTYLHLLEAFNFKDANKIFSSKTGLGILHSLNISHNKRHPFYLTPLAGVSFVQLTKKHENFKNFFEYFIGIGASYPVLPKLRPFLNITYNQIFKEWGSLQTYYSTHANFSLGTFFTF